MYEQTLDSSLLSRAQASSLAGETTDATDLNVGFRILASYGNGYAVTNDSRNTLPNLRTRRRLDRSELSIINLIDVCPKLNNRHFRRCAGIVCTLSST
jgi:hypothetical protein